MRGSIDGFQRELKSLRDQTHAAIAETKRGDLEDAFDLYRELLGFLLSQFRELEELFSVTPDDHWFNPFGREMDWLEHDIEDFARSILRNENPSAFGVLNMFLMDLWNDLWAAGEVDAHRRFVNLARRIYCIAVSYPLSREQSPRRLLANARSHVQHQVASSRASAASIEATMCQLVDVLFEAFRCALTTEDSRAAKDCLGEIDELNDTIPTGRRLRGKNDSEVVQIANSTRRRLGALSLAASVYVSKLASAQRLPEEVSSWVLPRLRELLDEEDLWDAFAEAHDDSAHDQPWSMWELDFWAEGRRVGPGGAITIGIDKLMAERLVREGSALDPIDALSGMSAPNALNLVRRVGDNLPGPAQSEAPPEGHDETSRRRRNIVSTEIASAVQHFEAADQAERGRQPLDPEKIERFFEGLAASWDEQTPLRAAVTTTVDEGDATTDLYGLHRIYDKDWFINSPGWDSRHLGNDIGGAMVRGEVERIYECARRTAVTPCALNELPKRATAALERLRADGYSPSIITLDSSRATYELTGAYDATGPHAPTYQEATVLQDHVGQGASCIVGDFASAIRLRRWTLPMDENETRLSGGLVTASVQDVTADVARDLVRRNREFRRNPDGTFSSTDEALLRLVNRVVVRVMSKVQIELVNAAAVELIVIDDPDW